MMNDNTKPGFIYCDRRIPYSIINEESETPMYVQEKFKRVFEYYDIYKRVQNLQPKELMPITLLLTLSIKCVQG